MKLPDRQKRVAIAGSIILFVPKPASCSTYSQKYFDSNPASQLRDGSTVFDRRYRTFPENFQSDLQ